MSEARGTSPRGSSAHRSTKRPCTWCQGVNAPVSVGGPMCALGQVCVCECHSRRGLCFRHRSPVGLSVGDGAALVQNRPLRRPRLGIACSSVDSVDSDMFRHCKHGDARPGLVVRQVFGNYSAERGPTRSHHSEQKHRVSDRRVGQSLPDTCFLLSKSWKQAQHDEGNAGPVETVQCNLGRRFVCMCSVRFPVYDLRLVLEDCTCLEPHCAVAL